MDRLFCMKVFCLVVDQSSMAAAARHLGLVPATISSAIARIEQDLGVRLLQRSTRSLKLTEAGALWYRYAKKILEQNSEAEQAVRDLALKPRGKLRINLTRGVAQRYIYPGLAEFSQCYPHIELDLQINDRLVDPIEQQFDITLRVGALQDSSLVARPLLLFQRITCASAAYLEAYGMPQTPAELTQHRCLLYRLQAEARSWDYWVDGELKSIAVTGPHSSNDSLALLTWAINGQGIIRMPGWYLAEALQQGLLTPILSDFMLKGKNQQQGIYAMLPKTAYRPAKVSAFLDFFATRMRF